VASKPTVRSYVSIVSVLCAAAACAGTSERSESVEQVDELLTRIERLQAETAVAKGAAHETLQELCTIVSPNFRGDAAAEFAKFLAASERSEEQAEVLRQVAAPMQESADELFHRWTKDMEAFGNSRMRQRSQTRLDETRTRFHGIVGAAQAAQIALDAFHDDVGDHALFLRHDLNSASVESLRADVRILNEQVQALDTRFDATVAAARAYVESAALYGQVEMESTKSLSAPDTQASVAKPTNDVATITTKKRTVTTLKPKAASAKPPLEAVKPVEIPAPVEPEPVPEPTPEPKPELPPAGPR